MIRNNTIEPTPWCSQMQPYEVSQSAKIPMGRKKQYLKLDWNEALIPPSPLVKTRLQEALESDIIHFYPDVTAGELKSKLSDYVGLDSSHIQVFNGSDDALQTICITYLSRSDAVLSREPSYSQFNAYVESTGARLFSFTGESAFAGAIEKYDELLCREAIKVVYIVNPNNPTGVMHNRDEICGLIVRHPLVLFIIDEAYFEYSGVTVADLVMGHDNLLVTRTFSKAFGLAGLRVGYVLGRPKIVEQLLKVRNGKNVNSLAQIAACGALDDIAYMEDYVAGVAEAREWLAAELRDLGLEVHETPANFILVRVADVPATIDGLRAENILVRDRSSLEQLEGYIRVSIGLPEQMKIFRDAMAGILSHRKDLAFSNK